MTLADLITLFREEAFDSLPGYIPVVGVPAPYQWSDSILKLYANEAQIEGELEQTGVGALNVLNENNQNTMIGQAIRREIGDQRSGVRR